MSSSSDAADPRDERDRRNDLARLLGFESYLELELAEEGIKGIDTQLSRFFLRNQPGGRDPLLRSLATSTTVLWAEIRDASIRYLPLVQLRQQPKDVRIAYMSHAPQHSLEITVHPQGLVSGKLVSNGLIQAYEISTPLADFHAQASALLERYITGVEGTGDTRIAKYGGPPNSDEVLARQPFYDALRINDFYANAWSCVDLEDAAVNIDSELLRYDRHCNPVYDEGGTSERHAIAKQAQAIWESLRSWSEEHEMPTFIISGEDHVYFNWGRYGGHSPQQSFQLVVRHDVASWCLVLNGRVVSFNANGRLADYISRMQRFALAVYGAPFTLTND